MPLPRALFLALAASSLSFPVSSAPVALTDATFDRETSAGVWFLEFYAPWCGHCKQLAPTIDALSTAAELHDTDVRVATIDCTTARGVCQRFSVGSYPTLKVVAHGVSYDFTGRREVSTMATFAQHGYKTTFGEPVLTAAEFLAQRDAAAAEQQENERQSAVVALTTAAFERDVLDSREPWLLKLYAPWCGHCKRLAPTWHKLSRSLQERGSRTRVATVDCTVHRRVCSRFGVQGYPSLIYIRDGLVYRYKGGRSLAALLDFVERGYETAEAAGPVPDEGVVSRVVDSVIEWAAEHTVLAVLACILAVAVVVAILVAMLDYWLGVDDVAQYRKVLDEKEKERKEGEKEEVLDEKEKERKEGEEEEMLPPRTPSVAEAKKAGQKPKDE